MARTFDARDPDQRDNYLAEITVQSVMYGETWQTLNEADGTITVWDRDEVPPARATVVP